MLETVVQLESDPPDTSTSASIKSVADSERVKVSVDVSPALRELSTSLSVMAMVGEAVSLLVESVACVAALPARSSTSAVMESVPSLRDERSRFETE